MTEKLYENNSYIKEFTAKVISSDERGTVLDKTAFFPEGGGQYGDTGYISGIRVTDTQIKDGIIYHITEAPVEQTEVNCTLDWNIRYNRMQNHTGEHILSGVINRKYGYNNVGFHMSNDEVTLDVDGKLTEEDIIWLEDEVNRIIDENREVYCIYPEGDELRNLQYRSKLDLTEGVRIVVIDSVDMCACCAPHVNTTAEVGLLKIVKHYNYKGGTRMHILCGDFARRDYRTLSEQNTKVANTYSAKRYELCEVVERLEKEIYTLKDQLRTLRSSVIESMVQENGGKGVCLYFADDFAMDELIKLADRSVVLYPDALTVALSGNDTDGFNFAIGGANAKDRFADFKARFNARGGGRDMYQGKVQSCKNELADFFNGIS
ncbi:MAG: hypothetical protein IKT46_04440 [Clostridia bacterium]|nr:hypothetical protein [Clostridia bacterium]